MIISKERLAIVRRRNFRIIVLAILLLLFIPVALLIIFSAYFSTMDISLHKTVVQQLKRVILFDKKEEKKDEQGNKKI